MQGFQSGWHLSRVPLEDRLHIIPDVAPDAVSDLPVQPLLVHHLGTYLRPGRLVQLVDCTARQERGSSNQLKTARCGLNMARGPAPTVHCREGRGWSKGVTSSQQDAG